MECNYCRVIFEHTGHKHCPIHEEISDTAALPRPSHAELVPTGQETDLCDLWDAQGVGQASQDVFEDIVE